MGKSEKELLERPVIKDEEVVLRALHEPFWDSEANRGTPSAFVGNRISVSRVAILSEESILAIFRRDLETESRVVNGFAEVDVASIRGCGETANGGDGVFLCVVEDPISTDNDAHAEIMGSDEKKTAFKKITRGVANKILQKCKFKVL